MKWKPSAVVLGIVAAATLAWGEFGGSYVVPLDHSAIQYAELPVHDPVARLQQRIAAGEVKLEYSQNHGFLPAVLEALGVPKESQVLVFSKTSFQAPRIAPRLPRAIYFNDAVSVGWVRGGDVLELAAVDPKQGVIFYTMEQDSSSPPRFERRDTCLQCHHSGVTVGVPGLLVRSVYPEPTGMPLFQAGSFSTDHRSPLHERWGGWYVSGTHGKQTHMGNAVVRDRQRPGVLDSRDAQNVTELANYFDTGAYLTPHSDIVALLMFEHQVRMTNLITRVGWEARIAIHDDAVISKALGRPENELGESALRRIHDAAEELLEYMLFTNEAPLADPVAGVSGLAESFAKDAPKDSKGRSLRDLDLRTRLLRYPCSYLIYTESFDGMPSVVRDRVYRRLWQVLNGEDSSEKFANLSKDDRTAILEILRETKQGLPDYWQPARN
jgi:hypothetical protein